MFNKELSKAYKSVFSTGDGKKVLKDLLRTGRYNEPTFVPNDPYTSAFNEGMRRMALRVVAFVEADLEKQVKLTNNLNNEE